MLLWEDALRRFGVDPDSKQSDAVIMDCVAAILVHGSDADRQFLLARLAERGVVVEWHAGGVVRMRRATEH
jgi:hypothetical protein